MTESEKTRLGCIVKYTSYNTTPYTSFFTIRVLWREVSVGDVYLIVLCEHVSPPFLLALDP